MTNELQVVPYVDTVTVSYISDAGFKPENAHGDDYCDDVRAAEGRLIPHGTFKSVLVPTGIKTAFIPEYGMKINTRSGSGFHTPIILSNSTGIIEGKYRGYIGVLLRNTFNDTSLVDFAFTTKGEQVPLSDIPKEVLENAREFYEEDSVNLGYDKPSTMEDFEKELLGWKKRKDAGEFAINRLTAIRKKIDAGQQLSIRENDAWLDQKAPQPTAQHRLFVDLVPRGTIYVEKGERIAQIHFQHKVKAKYIEVDELPETERGEGGYGSTGRK